MVLTMLDIKISTPSLICIVKAKNEFGDLNVWSQLDRDFKVVTIENNQFLSLLEQFDMTNPDVAIISFDYLAKFLTKDEWVELAEYCEIRHIPMICISNGNNQEVKRTILPEVIFTNPFDQNEFQLYLHKLIKRRHRVLDQILIDPISGANNFRFLKREVERQFNDMKRSYDPFSMVYIEMDQLTSEDYKIKRILMKEMIDFIQRSIRSTDCLAQHALGGFVLILPKTVKEDAIKLMKRLSKKFSEMPITTPKGIKSASFSSKVLEFAETSKSSTDCLALMPFNETDQSDRMNLVLDGAFNTKEIATRRLKLAIIDDDRLIREMLKHQLSDIGGHLYEVEIKVFADGEEFFNDPWHSQNERYLLIIDRVMPKMDGLEILNRIRTNYDRRRYLCFMVSSKGSETDISVAIQRGANEYMVKPFSLKELRVRINRLIGGAL